MDRLKHLNLLFLEDNIEYAKNTTEFLEIYLKKVFHTTTIKDAIKLYDENRIDIIISDIKVDDGNGLNFIKSIRKKDKDIPIVVLSAHKDEDFLFQAIPLHITSYQIKPLSYSKFLALLKELASIFDSLHTVFEYKNLSYSFKKKLLSIDGENIKLTNKEILFLELMIRNKDSVVTNEMVQRAVWENKFMSDSAIKNLVFRLRKKLPIELFSSVTSLGYKLSLNQ